MASRTMEREVGYTLKMDAGLHESLVSQARASNISLRGLMLSYLQRGLDASRIFPLEKIEEALRIAGIDAPHRDVVITVLRNERS